jgi:soluble lytic murein transglycosylase
VGEAEAAEARGRYAAAQAIYERVLAQSPLAPDVLWLRLAKVHLARHQPLRAIDAFRRLHDEFPLSAFNAEAARELVRLQALESSTLSGVDLVSSRARADRLVVAKRYREARAVYLEIEKHTRGAELDDVELQRGIVDYFMKDYAAARRLLRAHRDHPAHQPAARFYDLMAARALDAVAEFELLARDFVDRFGETTWAEEVFDALATHYIRQNGDQEADTVFRRLLTSFPNGRFAARAAWKVGWRAYRLGDAGGAAHVFERAAVAFPRSDYRPAYLYWAARAHESRGDRAAAVFRYALTETDYRHSYYGRLASTALASTGVPVPAALTTAATKTVSDESIAVVPTGRLIRSLLAAGLYEDAHNEIRYARHRWGDDPMLQATLGWLHHARGDLLAGANVTRRAYPHYVTARGDRLPREMLAVMFPVGYWNLIRQHADRHRLDPYLLAALIAQESAFVPDIRSSARATGLMQLMPATADRYARRLALPRPATLTDPALNIRLGTAYFADLVREFGDVHLALASYNAGESRVRRWLAERSGLRADEFIDDIPFPETQNYVKKILGAADNYRRIYRDGPALPVDSDRAIPSLASRRSAAPTAGPNQRRD